MGKMRKIIILSILGIAIIATFMLKNGNEVEQMVVVDGKLPILLDMSTET